MASNLYIFVNIQYIVLLFLILVAMVSIELSVYVGYRCDTVVRNTMDICVFIISHLRSNYIKIGSEKSIE